MCLRPFLAEIMRDISKHRNRARRALGSGPAQPPQPSGRLIQGFIPLAESESHLLCSIAWIVVEARSRHRGHAYFFHQVLRERYVVAKSETADVSHHVIRAPWAVTAEPSLRQRGNKPVTPPPITFGELLVINWRQTQSRRSGFLQRSRRSDSQKVVYFANRVCDLRRSNSPANTPPCHRICFRHAIDRDRALAHAIERSDRDVLRTVIQDMLVNFVRYGEYVELHTKIANQLQFGARENLAGRIIRRVSRDRLLRRFFDFAWSRKIRKSLRQVDRAILHCLARHFADHRLSEVRDLAAEKRL